MMFSKEDTLLAPEQIHQLSTGLKEGQTTTCIRTDGQYKGSSYFLPALQPNVITNSLARILSSLSSHSLSHRNGSKTPGLNAEYPAGLIVFAALIQQKLRDLEEM